jgi:replicative DNA helicase
MNARPLARQDDTRDFRIRLLAGELADRLAMAGFEPTRLADEGSERLLLAAMADGYWPREKVAPSDFFYTFHRDVAEVLDAARACDVAPTIQSLARGVEALGASGPHIETGIETLIYETPTVMHVDELAHRIRRLAWLRRMVAVTDRLRAHLVEPAIDDAAIEAAIDALVAVATTQPTSPRPGGAI